MHWVISKFSISISSISITSFTLVISNLWRFRVDDLKVIFTSLIRIEILWAAGSDSNMLVHFAHISFSNDLDILYREKSSQSFPKKLYERSFLVDSRNDDEFFGVDHKIVTINGSCRSKSMAKVEVYWINLNLTESYMLKDQPPLSVKSPSTVLSPSSHSYSQTSSYCHRIPDFPSTV